MGQLRLPQQVQYFASIIFGKESDLLGAKQQLTSVIGDISEETAVMPFSKTNYYEKEMGGNLLRIFVLFEPLMQREMLPGIKLKTNDIEASSSKNKRRVVNIDPGYISLENIILATTKGYAHRIYIGSGIYGDLTLMYNTGSFRPLMWTYPDYRSEDIISLFNGWREVLKAKLKGVALSKK